MVCFLQIIFVDDVFTYCTEILFLRLIFSNFFKWHKHLARDVSH